MKIGPRARRILARDLEDAIMTEAEKRARAELTPERIRGVRQATDLFRRAAIARPVEKP